MMKEDHLLAVAQASIQDTVFLPLNPSPVPVLHIRCGSDIYDGLRQAGIPGVFLEVSDPACQGPLNSALPAAELRRQRAEFIAATYHHVGDAARVLEKLEAEARGLAQLERFDKIVLWFEHDLYDQAILIRLLARLRGQPALHPRLSIISINAFPGMVRFTGLGQLSAHQLASLWGTETPVTQAQLDSAAAIWEAYAAADPILLQQSLRKTDAALPFAGAALTRHLQELPWRGLGLGLTEQLVLKELGKGAATPGRVFARLVEDLDPLPYLGDAMFWPLLAGLAEADTPALTAFSDWRDDISLTDFGHKLLAGQANWLDYNRLNRWVGGLHLKGSTPAFLWDPEHAEAVANT